MTDEHQRPIKTRHYAKAGQCGIFLKKKNGELLAVTKDGSKNLSSFFVVQQRAVKVVLIAEGLLLYNDIVGAQSVTVIVVCC